MAILALSLPNVSGENLEQMAKSSLTYYDLKDNSLVGWWKLNDGSRYNGTADSSGWGNTGSLVNMNFNGNATSGWTTSGKFGNALQFDGTDDVVVIAW